MTHQIHLTAGQILQTLPAWNLSYLYASSFCDGSGHALGQSVLPIQLCPESACKGCGTFTHKATQQEEEFINCLMQLSFWKIFVVSAQCFQHIQPINLQYFEWMQQKGVLVLAMLLR